MTDLLSVKVAAAAPAGATAVGEYVCADRLTKIPGVKKAVAERNGFKGAVGTAMTVIEGDVTRIIAGLGPSAEADDDALTRATAAIVRTASGHRRLALIAPEMEGEPSAREVGLMAEATILAAYSFVELKSKPEAAPKLNAVTVVHEGDLREARAEVAAATAVADAVCFARDLVNLPGGELTPARFARLGAERAEQAGLRAEILDEKSILELGLGGLLAVNKGSVHPPRLLKLVYEPEADSPDDLADEPTGAPPRNSGPDDLETVALVGKGITFDSGGLSLKPADAMDGMKMDMAGAAAVIAAMCTLADLDVRVRVVSFTPMTDNMTGGDAQRPGDVYTARSGMTVEVLNTDAEGRLILGDALSLAVEEKSIAIIDLATLTGACMVALGERIAGLLSNDDTLAEQVAAAAEEAGERVWRLPLPPDYRKQLDSDVADIKNIGTRYGGTLTAGLFLKEFVKDVPWVHLDIAGPAWAKEPDGVNPKGGTGFGVRTLARLLAGWGRSAGDGDPELEAQAAEDAT
jgi:leucyl aminopeptidase